MVLSYEANLPRSAKRLITLAITVPISDNLTNDLVNAIEHVGTLIAIPECVECNSMIIHSMGEKKNFENMLEDMIKAESKLLGTQQDVSSVLYRALEDRYDYLCSEHPEIFRGENE